MRATLAFVPWLCLLLLVAATSCDHRSKREPHVLEGLYRVDRAIREGNAYEDVLARIDEARTMREANLAAYAIAQHRFTAALYYGGSRADVEGALRERLRVDDDRLSRARTAGAAYATHPELKSYFDAAVAYLEAAPRTPIVERALESAARVRTRMAAMEEHLAGNPSW